MNERIGIARQINKQRSNASTSKMTTLGSVLLLPVWVLLFVLKLPYTLLVCLLTFFQKCIYAIVR